MFAVPLLLRGETARANTEQLITTNTAALSREDRRCADKKAKQRCRRMAAVHQGIIVLKQGKEGVLMQSNLTASMQPPNHELTSISYQLDFVSGDQTSVKTALSSRGVRTLGTAVQVDNLSEKTWTRVWQLRDGTNGHEYRLAYARYNPNSKKVSSILSDKKIQHAPPSTESSGTIVSMESVKVHDHVLPRLIFEPKRP